MANTARRGRPQKPYTTSWGEPIVGLYRCPDGRWRINATGKKFTEPDERRAVARFRAEQRPGLVRVPSTITVMDRPTGADGRQTGPLMLRAETLAENFWPWLREQLITQPEYVAKMVGIPELANLRHLPLPKPAIKIADLIETYRRENPSTDKSKREAVAVFDRLVKHAGATTLDDLTQDALLAWRAEVEGSGKLTSAGTRQSYYGRIKTVIGFGLKAGMDQTQICAALDRCKVLWTAEALPPVQPQPISREHFHRLLGAGNGTWRPWLLLALNLCMTMEDLCELRWCDFDLEAGTYAAIRVKTRRKRVPRAGVLWRETIAALKSLPRRSEYVFTSSHGTRYNRNTRVNNYADLREQAGLPDEVKFNTIRDGAYTAASRATSDERWARVLAGHAAAGLQDNYVLRNPAAVRPACEAVYAEYGPFPAAD